MSMSYKELLQQRQALEAQIAAARQNEVAEFGLTAQDIFPSGRRGRAASTGAGSVGVPKYRDPATGATWTGRGKPPNWINGKDRDQFLIEA
jgi:DNA-binding protein H-NS